MARRPVELALGWRSLLMLFAVFAATMALAVAVNFVGLPRAGVLAGYAIVGLAGGTLMMIIVFWPHVRRRRTQG